MALNKKGMGFLDAVKKIPVIGQVVAVGEGVANIAVAGVKVLNGVLKTFDRFPANLVCGLVLIILHVLLEIIKIDVIGYTLVFFVYVIPFVLRLLYIYMRYWYFVIVTKVVESMDPEKGLDHDVSDAKTRAGSALRRFLIFIQTCHPDPRQWYTYPQNHWGNTHEVRLGLACMNPCGSKYVPYFGGLLCKKADRRVPRYCPKAMIMRAFEGLDVDGSKDFASASPKMRAACAANGAPSTSFESRFGTGGDAANEVLSRGVCQQPRLLLDDPGAVAHACHETYCKRGDRRPFCSRIEPRYSDLADDDPTQLLKIPGLLLMSAVLLQIARFYMYQTQSDLMGIEYDMWVDKRRT